MVWLNLIPLFNYVWNFITVIRVGDSLKNEFTDRDIDEGGDYGKTLGITMSRDRHRRAESPLERRRAARMPASGSSMIAGPVRLASLVMFIIYWVKIAGSEPKTRR